MISSIMKILEFTPKKLHQIDSFQFSSFFFNPDFFKFDGPLCMVYVYPVSNNFAFSFSIKYLVGIPSFNFWNKWKNFKLQLKSYCPKMLKMLKS